MSCEKMASGILPYIEGRLKETGRAEMERHVATCASCRLRMEEFHAATALLDQLPVIEPSTAFDVRVRALVAGEPVKRRWWPSLRLSPRVALAASVLLIAALWYGFYEQPSTPALPWSSPEVADEQLMQDLPVLEDHELLSNFEPLKELSSLAEAPSGTPRMMEEEDPANRH